MALEYDAHYEWLWERADKLDELARAWVSETIDEQDSKHAAESFTAHAETT